MTNAIETAEEFGARCVCVLNDSYLWVEHEGCEFSAEYAQEAAQKILGGLQRERDAAIRADERARFYRRMRERCRETLIAAVSQEWLAAYEQELLNGTPVEPQGFARLRQDESKGGGDG